MYWSTFHFLYTIAIFYWEVLTMLKKVCIDILSCLNFLSEGLTLLVLKYFFLLIITQLQLHFIFAILAWLEKWKHLTMITNSLCIITRQIFNSLVTMF